MLMNPYNMHKNIQKVLLTGQKLTAIPKFYFSPGAANFCCGWVKSPICEPSLTIQHEMNNFPPGTLDQDNHNTNIDKNIQR